MATTSSGVEAVSEVPTKDQEPKYATLQRLFKAVERGEVKSLKHATLGHAGSPAFLVGTEGKGRGVRERLLWKGDQGTLTHELLKRAGVRVLAVFSDL